jgi:hypothetical protein
MHFEWFNGIEILQGRWQHGEKVGLERLFVSGTYMSHWLNVLHMIFGGTRWRSWLRHYATRRKFAGSIADGVIGIFHWNNPSGRTMVLGLTQPLTEMSTRNISWG